MSHRSRIIDMHLDGQPSRIVVGPLAALELSRFIPQPPPAYIVDEAVARLQPAWLEQLQAGCDPDRSGTLVLPGGEGSKRIEQLAAIYAWLAARGVPRDGTLVGIGGGALLDVAGFAAATWQRGIGWVSVPTTLLAMIDAAIGGKTAINVAGLKNQVGAFHPAAGIMVDCGFLLTLPRGGWRDGLAEMIKTAVIGDVGLFAELEAARPELRTLFGATAGAGDEPVPGVLGALPWRDWVGRAAAVKAEVVGRDFHEQGPRRALNLGHTLGHALEAWTAGTPTALSHGQAVAIGMAVVFRVAAERGGCPLTLAVRVIELLEDCGLPTRWPAPPEADLERLLGADKKRRGGRVRWVLPRGLRQLDLDGAVDTAEILRWLD
jgi:3-dehydroquinate synthetase